MCSPAKTFDAKNLCLFFKIYKNIVFPIYLLLFKYIEIKKHIAIQFIGIRMNLFLIKIIIFDFKINVGNCEGGERIQKINKAIIKIEFFN